MAFRRRRICPLCGRAVGYSQKETIYRHKVIMIIDGERVMGPWCNASGKMVKDD